MPSETIVTSTTPEPIELYSNPLQEAYDELDDLSDDLDP